VLRGVLAPALASIEPFAIRSSYELELVEMLVANSNSCNPAGS